MSNGPITAKERFLKNVGFLSEKIRANGAIPVLYVTYHEAADQNGALIVDVENIHKCQVFF